MERGARVALVDLREQVEESAAELGDSAIAFVTDVTDPADLDKAVAGTIDRFGGIDVTIAGAGITGTASPIESIDPANFEQVLEVNLLGVWRTLKATMPHVVERQGYLLPIASIAAVIPTPLLTAYGVSKAGVEAFARGLRVELAHTGTKVGVAYFGVIETDMVRDAYAQPLVAKARSMTPGIIFRGQPVGAAGKAIVRGIERRAKWVYSPFWVPALLTARGLLGPTEGILGRDKRFIETYRPASP